MSDSTITTKTCTNCKQSLPATKEFFHKNNRYSYGLNNLCKNCKKIIGKQYYQANQEKILEDKKKYREAVKENLPQTRKPFDSTVTKICSKCKKGFPATPEYFTCDKMRPDGLHSWCKSCKYTSVNGWYEVNQEQVSEYNRQKYANDREEKLKQQKQYYRANPEKKREYGRRYYFANREKKAEYSKKYRKNNPDKKRIYESRREARKLALPDTLTHQEWQQAIQYFNGCCAVCENQLYDLFGEIILHADHWIALNNPDCPGTIVTNMLPLCSACNSSKRDSPPKDWLIRKHGKRKANQILKRIEAYFESVRESITPT